MKYWKYIHYDDSLGYVPIEHPKKEPFIWSNDQPEVDYEDITTEDLLIAREAELYPQRRVYGQQFADFMSARLVVLGNKIPNATLSYNVRGLIDLMFKDARDQVFQGSWISAKREINKVVPSSDLAKLIIAYNLPIDQEGLIAEIKGKIDNSISQLYDL